MDHTTLLVIILLVVLIFGGGWYGRGTLGRTPELEPVEVDSMAFDRARRAFGPEALSRFTQILEEVTLDLIGDGVPVELMRSKEMRTRLAQRSPRLRWFLVD